MSRTHHATRTWRLSCGCLRDYPGMPLGRTHQVLCVACRKPVKTLYPYEEDRCGYTTTARTREGKVIHVSCTEDTGNEQCGVGVHYDRNVELRFEAHKKLRARRDGSTGKI